MTFYYYLEYFLDAVRCVLKDDGFKLPTLPATTALKAAESFLKWEAENKSTFETFALETAKVLRACIHSGGKSHQAIRERTWAKYYKLRTSEAYNTTWKRLLDAIGCNSTPLLWQYVSDKLFDHLLKEKFAIPEVHQGTVKSKFTYEEANAVRYTAGYVCRSVRTKLNKRSSQQFKELTHC